MRKMHSTNRYKFAINQREYQWLVEMVAAFRNQLVDGMSFYSALTDWSDGLNFYPSGITVKSQTTQQYGREYIVQVSPEDMQPLVDMLAIMVDGDQDIRTVNRNFAQAFFYRLRQSYSINAQYREKMRQVYAPVKTRA